MRTVADLDNALMKPMFVNRMARAMLSEGISMGWASDARRQGMKKSCETRIARSEERIKAIIISFGKEWADVN